MKKIIMITALSCLLGQVYAKDYPIQATMIKPEMQNSEYQVEKVENDNFLGTLTCTNGEKVKIYNKKDIYVGDSSSWEAKTLIHYSILGDLIAKAIESDSVFIGGNTSWPIVVGAEVAKEGIIQYSEKHEVNPDKKENALNITAGISTGSSMANLMMITGISNPIGIFVGIIGGIVIYNQADKQYELKKRNAGKIKVLVFMNHPVNPDKAYACE